LDQDRIVKKRIKVGAENKAFAPGEHVRVVPLHYPEPIVSVGAELTYRSGPLITNVELFTVFCGKRWGSTPSSTDLMSKLNQFFTDILVSPLIDQLAEYDVPGQPIGHGSLIGTKVISANAPARSVTDSAIRRRLKQWIAANTVPKNNKNSLYFIYLDPGVVSIMGGSRSCQSYCGYHNNFGKIYYAVAPYPTCSGCLGGLQVFDAITGTSSHELCEAITDAVPGTGWYDDTNGEIGDICAWNFKTVAGYTVQLEWSNQQGKCV
jgi:hypothetical protein